LLCIIVPCQTVDRLYISCLSTTNSKLKQLNPAGKEAT
ncbi:MAG: hypothetical protein ACI9FD_004922, partial [Gammaproteobacteria bacterium]